jgi:peptide/nickel transport system substrate-binding protein
MDFRILGPLEVVGDDGPVALGGAKQRALLAVLLLHEGEAVSTDRLVDELWGESPPPTATKTVQVYVSHLRRALGNGTLETQGRGYRLRPPPGEFDLARFRGLADEGRTSLAEGDPRRAAEILRSAVALWRGPPLVDFAFEPFAQQRVPALEEERIAVTEDRIDADLALGRHAELVAELRELVRTHPLRERLRGQLMLALYRSGRQAEALECFQDARHTLVEELGLDPGPDLRELEAAILAQDPAIAAPRTVRVALPARTPRPTPAMLLGAGALVLALVAAAVVVAVTGESGGGRPVFEPDTLAALDGGNPARQRHDVRYTALAAGSQALWAIDPRRQALVRLDSDDAGVRDTIPVGGGPAAVAVAGDSVWVANAADGTVSRVSAERGTAVQTVSTGNGPSALAVGAGVVWVANRLDSTVVRLDAATGARRATIALPSEPGALVVSSGAVWVSSQTVGAVYRIEPADDAIAATIPTGRGAGPITGGPGGVWVANAGDGTVSRIDPSHNAVAATIPVGGEATALAATRDAIWAGRMGPAALVRIDPRTTKVTRTVALEVAPAALASAGSRVWVATGAASHRGGTLRLVNLLASTPSADPALSYDAWEWSLLVNVYDGLVAYRRTGGAAGSTLVPDLATSLPVPSDAGRTYRFQLRRGIRFADGSLLRARDVRWTLERVFRLQSPGAAYSSAIRGAQSCNAHRCDLSRGIVTDDERVAVVFPLSRPDPELLTKLALPFVGVVPSSTPARDTGVRPPPGTGPYRVATYAPTRQVVLVRNPRFREWSAEAQPAANPDRISMRPVNDPEAAVSPRAIASSDIAAGDPSPKDAEAILARFADRTYDTPLAAMSLAFMNTRVPPFDDVRVRRAANLAVDRGKLVKLLGGPLVAQATCQALPPGLPGYRPYCPYTARPSRSGVWNAPAVTKARRLISASGHRGDRVVLWSAGAFLPTARAVAADLRKIGLRVSIHRASGVAAMFDAASDSRRRVQIHVSGWGADYPTANGFLFNVYDCRAFTPGSTTNTNFAEFCDRRSERAMDRARAAESVDAAAAARLWAVADRRITDAAPTIPIASYKTVNIVSRRVDGVEFHPVWGPLLSQVSVRGASR